MLKTYITRMATDEFGRVCFGSEPDVQARLLRAYWQGRECSCAAPAAPINPTGHTLHNETALMSSALLP